MPEQRLPSQATSRATSRWASCQSASNLSKQSTPTEEGSRRLDASSVSSLGQLEHLTLGPRRKAIRRNTALKGAANWGPIRISVHRFTESTAYNVFMVLLILFNIVHMVHETDLRARNVESPNYMKSTARVFLSTYTLDLLLRVYVYRRRFVHSGMNMFDCFVVVLDILTEATASSLAGNIPSLSVMRGLRMLRIVRVIRKLVAFRELYLMMQGIVSAIRAIIFGTTLIVVVLMMWSILAVELIQAWNLELYREGAYGDCNYCEHAFASVGHAMMTFTSTIIAGDSWGKLAIPLVQRRPWSSLIIIPALLSLELGLLNVVAAVIVDRQAQARQDDEKFLHQMRDEDLKKSYTRLKTLFSSMDDDMSGSLTLDELKESFDTHAEFKELMELMDITEEDLGLVFQILDKDGSGDISYNEFVSQLNTMRTTNGHTMLVFIKFMASRIQEQMDEQDFVLMRIQEALGMEEMRPRRRPAMNLGNHSAPLLGSTPAGATRESPGEEASPSTPGGRISRCSRVGVGAEGARAEVEIEEAIAQAVAEPASPEAQVSRPMTSFHRSTDQITATQTAKAGTTQECKATVSRSTNRTRHTDASRSCWAQQVAPTGEAAADSGGGTNKSEPGVSGSAAITTTATIEAQILALSRHVQSSLAAITEEAVRQAGQQVLTESTRVLVALQASLPKLQGLSLPQSPELGVPLQPLQGPNALELATWAEQDQGLTTGTSRLGGSGAVRAMGGGTLPPASPDPQSLKPGDGDTTPLLPSFGEHKPDVTSRDVV